MPEQGPINGILAINHFLEAGWVLQRCDSMKAVPLGEGGHSQAQLLVTLHNSCPCLSWLA